MPQSDKATKYDLLVIGAGSGGATMALEAAALGVRCAVFEDRSVGGTCVHRGCVPKKLLWHSAEMAGHKRLSAGYGVDIPDETRIDYARLHSRTRDYVASIGGWYQGEFERHGVTLVRHPARFVDARTLVADGVSYRGERVVVASGARPVRPGFPGGELAISSDEFFDQGLRPGRIAIVGSGYIAVELGAALAETGARVSLVVRRDRLSSHFDGEMMRALAGHLSHQGVDILWRHRSAGIERREDGGLRLGFEDGREALDCDCVLWATGRGPNTEGLGLDEAGVATDERGAIIVDKDQATNVEGIYALGDVTGRHELTPVAIRAARCLVRRLYKNEPVPFDYSNIPTVIYAHPPMASIGLSEDEARARHGEGIKVWRSSFVPLGHDLAIGRPPPALIKLITAEPEGKVVGLHILAPGADEMMQGFAVAINMGASKADFDRCVALHPTVAEEVVTLK